MLLPLKVDVAPLACRDDLVDMGFRPVADRRQRFAEREHERGQLVLDPGRDLRVGATDEEPAPAIADPVEGKAPRAAGR
jgi:hypothetical protein